MSVDEVSRLDELSKLNPIYPHWMLQFTYMDRTSAEKFLLIIETNNWRKNE